MKKKYIKPEIFFENFSICTSIAAGCEHTNNVVPTDNTQGCGYKLDRHNTVVFIENICQRAELDGEYNGICYHNPSEDANIFNS